MTVPERLLDERVANAWRRLGTGVAEPTCIETVRRGRHETRVIYRLTGVGPRGAAVIAKKCPADTGWIERTIYEQILPRLPVSSPRFHGYADDGGEFGWLFIEDVGRERFSPDSEEHRALAARWLGVMHTTAARVEHALRLPDRGPNHYLDLLRSARLNASEHLTDPRLGTDERAVLKRVVRQCDDLEAGWASVERCCDGVPATLVHGDFRRKNVYVRTTDHAGAELFPIDWETAGWGVPAADLAPSRSRHAGRHLELDAYWSIVRSDWPGLEMSGLEQLVRVGLVFRRLAAMHWASMGLGSEATEAVGLMGGYHAEVAEVMRMPPWDE